MSMPSFLADNQLGLSESFFVATNPTPGTGIVNVDTGLDAVTATAALMTHYNSASASAGDNQWAVPIYMRLTATAVNTAGVDFRLVINLDNIQRYASGGTTLTLASTSVDTRTGYTNRTPKSVVNFGSVVAAAAGSAQQVANAYLSPVIFAADDSCELVWGDGATSYSATAQNVARVLPMYIGRQCTMVIHELAKSQTASPDFEVEYGFAELRHTRF